MGFVGYPVGADGTTLELGGSGLALVAAVSFTSVSDVNIDNCFTSAFTNYMVVYAGVTSGTQGNIRFRLRAGGVTNSSANYKHGTRYMQFSTTSGNSDNATSSPATGWLIGSVGSTDNAFGSVTIYRPAVSVMTAFTGVTAGQDRTDVGGGVTTVTTAYDGISLYHDGAAAMTGSVSIYGYRKA